MLGATQMFIDERLPQWATNRLFGASRGSANRRVCSRSSRTRAFGNIAGARGCTPIRRRCAGWPAIASALIASRLGLQTARNIGTRTRHAIRDRILAERLGREARRADRRAWPSRSRRQRFALRRTRFAGADGPALCQHLRRHRPRFDAQRAHHALHATTISARPETAFLACSFWYIDALCQIGRKDEAREMFETHSRHAATISGCCPKTSIRKPGELWGNFPQAYSMAGIINTATRLSSSWEEAWARV